ncbi:jg19050 [Pararge aegeria aegeria]|uniref:Jg19050 protein n=3 Tax=Pararge aegeria TaxID=116150 RepID=A0A8S4QZL6_9NEOP|nr:jg19050 [Pararge aegeria aegeria]
MTPGVQQVVEFTKRIPGFTLLPQDDQLILIKLGFFEVWASRASSFFTPDDVVFDDGTSFNQTHLETMYDTDFSHFLLRYAQRVAKLRLSEPEMALYTAWLMLCPVRAGLTDREGIAALHKSVEDALQVMCQVHMTRLETNTRLDALNAVAVDAYKLGARHDELLGWCRINWQRLLLPALFAEIFDIPKAEEEENAVALAPAMQVQV